MKVLRLGCGQCRRVLATVERGPGTGADGLPALAVVSSSWPAPSDKVETFHHTPERTGVERAGQTTYLFRCRCRRAGGQRRTYQHQEATVRRLFEANESAAERVATVYLD